MIQFLCLFLLLNQVFSKKALNSMQTLYCESPFPKELTTDTYVVHWPAKACHLELRPCPKIAGVQLLCTYSVPYRGGKVCCIAEQHQFLSYEYQVNPPHETKPANEQQIDQPNHQATKFINYIIPGIIGGKKPIISLPPIREYSPLARVYLPMPNPYPNQPRKGPMVTPIILGDVQMKPGEYKMPSTVTWVRDGQNGECDIVVDTGIPMHKNTVVGGLAAHGLRPDQIEYVVLTHSAPDSIGNLNLFLNAEIFSGNMRIQRDTFYQRDANFVFTRPGSGPAAQNRSICNNTALYLTAGHSLSDLTVVVRNVEGFGTVAITGNLFFTEHDIEESSIWRQFSWDPAMQELNRRIVLCLADYIVPGHGKTFRVTQEMKEKFSC